MARELGDKIGPRLSQLVGAHVLAARRDHAPLEAKIRQVATQALIDKAGLEVAQHIAPLIHAAIDANPDMHPEVKAYLLRTASGKHQLQAIAGFVGLQAAGSALSTLLQNELAPLVYPIIASNPHLRLDPQTAARLNAVGLFSDTDAANEGNAQGFDSNRMAWLKQLQQSVPDSQTIGQMLDRGLLSLADANYWIHRGGYGDDLHAPLLALRRLLLSPADAALGVLRGNISHDAGVAIAKANGMDAADFQTFIDNTGEPLALEQLAEAWRRGFIGEADFKRGLLQSRVRDEWLRTAEQLRYEPMSTADAVEAAVQGHLSQQQMATIADHNGLEPGQVDTLYLTAGEPLSRTEMDQLYNRGLVTKDQVDQAARESRLKDKYVPLAYPLHVRLPEGRQVVSAITHGAATKDQGLRLLAELGYSAEVAQILVAEGTNAKLGTHHALTVAEIRQLYTAAIFTRAHAEQLLTSAGYDTADAEVLIRSWDLLATAAITRQAIGAVRSRYVARHIDWTTAETDLVALGVPATAHPVYKRTWDIELAATTRQLTEAQIVAAHKKTLISGQDAYQRLVHLGYDTGDAKILLGVAPGDAVPP
jgi:hypothetical protein